MSTESLDNTIPQGMSPQCICLGCSILFYVYPKINYAGGLPNQTLFCGECLNSLRNSITREKTNNYGF
jgi:hypothetical protein